MKLPRYTAPISLRSTPAFFSAVLAASTARLSRPLPSCLPNSVEPIPVIATSRIAGLRQKLSQFRLEYLAVAVLGEALDDSVMPRPLVARDVVEAKRIEILSREIRFRTRHHERHDFLAPFRMRAAYDGAFEHHRVRE